MIPKYDFAKFILEIWLWKLQYIYINESWFTIIMSHEKSLYRVELRGITVGVGKSSKLYQFQCKPKFKPRMIPILRSHRSAKISESRARSRVGSGNIATPHIVFDVQGLDHALLSVHPNGWSPSKKKIVRISFTDSIINYIDYRIQAKVPFYIFTKHLWFDADIKMNFRNW